VKVFAFIAAVVIATALIMGGTFLIVAHSAHRLSGVELLAIVPLTVFVYGPLLLGSLTTYWDVDVSDAGRRSFRRFLWVVLGLESLSGVAVVVYAVLTPAPPWLAVLFIGGGAVLTVLALAVGRALRRYTSSREATRRPFAAVDARDLRKRILIVAGVFALAVVVGLVVFLGFLADPADGVATELSLALQFAFLAGGIAALAVTFPLNKRLRETVGSDLGAMRRVSREVLGRKDMQLDPGEQVAAARYAALAPTVLGFSLTYLGMLYLALLMQQARLLDGGTHSHLSPVFTIGLTIALVAFLAFFTPYYLVRIQRARRYARDHANLLDSAQPAGPAGTAA